MSLPIPNFNANPDTLPRPPVKKIYVEATFGPGADDHSPGEMLIHGDNLDYSSGVGVGYNTADCDHTTGMDFWVMPGRNFWPVMLGWMEYTYDGTDLTSTMVMLELGTGTQHFDWDDIYGTPPWTYRAEFYIWRITP